MTEILVLYYSAGGAVREMAHLVARGVNQVAGARQDTPAYRFAPSAFADEQP